MNEFIVHRVLIVGVLGITILMDICAIWLLREKIRQEIPWSIHDLNVAHAARLWILCASILMGLSLFYAPFDRALPEVRGLAPMVIALNVYIWWLVIGRDRFDKLKRKIKASLRRTIHLPVLRPIGGAA